MSANPRCAGCVHPPHIGQCFGRNGQTAYRCGCLVDYVPDSPTRAELLTDLEALRAERDAALADTGKLANDNLRLHTALAHANMAEADARSQLATATAGVERLRGALEQAVALIHEAKFFDGKNRTAPTWPHRVRAFEASIMPTPSPGTAACGTCSRKAALAVGVQMRDPATGEWRTWDGSQWRYDGCPDCAGTGTGGRT